MIVQAARGLDRPLRVLLVEDSSTDAKLIVHELRRAGRVVEFERVDTAAAMRAALARAAWDVVLSDWSMPTFSAPAANVILRELGLDLPFIIVSGTIGEETAVLAMRAGAEDFVLKENLARLTPAIERGLRECGERAARRAAEAALRASEARFRLVVEASPDAILLVDGAGAIRLVNRRAEELFGYDRDELIGRAVELLVPDRLSARHADQVSAYVREPTAGPVIARRELYGRHKDGREIPLEIGLNPMPTPDGLLTLASIVDITERKRTDDELRRSNAELEQFAYIASHDLQEPLRMVASFTELLAQRYKGRLDERADRYIHFAVDGAKRMQRLVADLLAYSRVGSQGQPLVPVASEAVAREVVQMLAPLIRTSGATVEVGPLPIVLADEVQLRQLFQNLIGNAIKFRGEAAPVVRIRAALVDERWQFEVADNGIGIEMQYADRIFLMFQRLHERGTYDGSGIGLSIAKRILERHGGRMWFTSTVGAGTTFHFTLVPVLARAA